MISKYNFKEVEESVLDLWKKKKIHDKLKERNKKGKKFYFLQGPPYTSGRLHIGHAWNSAMKDMIMRYHRLQGRDVWDRAGYDMHGLPTENKVQDKLKLKYKEDIIAYGMEKFIKECKEFSVTNAKLMDKDLARLAVWMDYENAYYPITNEFMSAEWLLIKKASEQKRLYKGKKIMHWCSSCETALAKHELEYENDKDTSIFLKFKLKGKDEYLLIWTTTPWTIPFNLGVMVNPELEYLKVKVEGQIWYISKALAGIFIQSMLGKKFEILEEFKGGKMEGWEYEHPLYDELKEVYDKLKKESPKVHTVFLSKEYVDTTAGTGLVHNAPGCGPEDFEVAKKYKVKAFNHLNEKGQFEDMGKFDGMQAKVDDKKFIEIFKEKGCLIESSPVEHEYAHCWRCHNPVVFRTTEQWFLKIEDLIPKILDYDKDIQWVPETAKKSYESWITNLKDNGITRQRFWGTPVPIWECECGNVEVIGSQEELKKKATSEVPADLHKPWIDDVTVKCSKCKKDIKRIPDVLDVWLDSGTVSWNCLEYPQREDYFKKYFPADVILEATEQTRLWFSMLQICSTIVFGKQSYVGAYNTGMIFDFQGVKMSKSLGNIISPYEVIDKYGADILRYYISQINAGENINFNWEEVKQKQRSLLVLWNVHNFLINASKDNKFNPTKVKNQKLETEEKYILSKLNSTIKKVTEMFDQFELDSTIGEIEELFLDLSRTYMQLTRDKVSLGSKEQKEAVLGTIYKVLLDLITMFSPIAPFITEQIYQNLKETFKLKEESVHMLSWPKYDEKLINPDLEMDMAVYSNVLQSILYAREKAQLGLRWPVKEVIITTSDKDIIKSLENTGDLLKTQANFKEIKIQPSLPGIKQSVKADFKKLGPDFGALAPKIISKLALESPAAILEHLNKEKSYKLKIDGEEVNIVKEHLIVERDVPEQFVENEIKGGFIYLNKERTDELEAEGYSREIMRRIQSKRKDAELTKTDKITLFIKTDDELKEMLTKFEKNIKEKVGANILKISELDPSKKHEFTSKEKVKGKEFELFFDSL